MKKINPEKFSSVVAEVANPESSYGVSNGVVRSFINLGAATAVTPSSVIRKMEHGLPLRELDDLQSSLDLPMDKLAPMLGIAKATLHRRKLAGHLDTSESDRVVRFARLTGRAIAVLESAKQARLWLLSPQFGLGGAIPLEYAKTEVGAREVEHLLGRIEYGVYS